VKEFRVKYQYCVRLAVLSLTALAPLASAGQSSSMRANIVGGNGGKCTFEIEVDGVAEVEIRGSQGYLRTISGSRATWRRLQCSEPLPKRPNDFRFKGVDGRGRQDLSRDPNSNGGTAVIRVEDPQGGREGYTGDIFWNSGGGNYGGSYGGSHGAFGDSGSGGAFGGSGGNNWGGGWDNSWGSNINYSGRGSGNFDRQGGPQYSLRGVRVSVNRQSGRVHTEFDTNAGHSTITFTGRTTRISSRTVEADISSATNRNKSARANGNMRIKMDNNGTVRSIEFDGDVEDGRFNLNWNN
jgi:hypothetical protein